LKVPSGGLSRFNANPEQWLKCVSLPKGFEYVDPDKEVKADIEAIAVGLDSPVSILGRRGKTVEEVAQETAQAVEVFKRHGLDAIVDNMFKIPPMIESAEGEDPEVEEDEEAEDNDNQNEEENSNAE
jgi:capsid protein